MRKQDDKRQGKASHCVNQTREEGCPMVWESTIHMRGLDFVIAVTAYDVMINSSTSSANTLMITKIYIYIYLSIGDFEPLFNQITSFKMADDMSRNLVVLLVIIPHPVASEHRWLVKAPRWIHSVPDVSRRRSWRCGCHARLWNLHDVTNTSRL